MQVYDQGILINRALTYKSVAIIILDACRYDYFEKVYRKYVNGILLKAWSRGSCTPEWLINTFIGFYDVVYVSANAFLAYNIKHAYLKDYQPAEHFTKIVEVHKTDWDNKLQTVKPESVVKRALENLYPRMIIHFIQPHAPYISPKLQILGSEEHIMRLLAEGKITIQTVRLAYQYNLEYALANAAKLIANLPHELIIITSDHGEYLGEKRWGNYPYAVIHPPNSNHKVLREVPFLIVRGTFHLG